MTYTPGLMNFLEKVKKLISWIFGKLVFKKLKKEKKKKEVGFFQLGFFNLETIPLQLFFQLLLL